MASKSMTAPSSTPPKGPASGAAADKPGIVVRIREFFDDVMSEMRKVSWPTYDELKSLTQLVLWSLIVSGAVLGLYDVIFNNLMSLILRLG